MRQRSVGRLMPVIATVLSTSYFCLGAFTLVYSALYFLVSPLGENLPMAPEAAGPLRVLGLVLFGLALLVLAMSLSRSAKNLELACNGRSRINWRQLLCSLALLMACNGFAAVSTWSSSSGL